MNLTKRLNIFVYCLYKLLVNPNLSSRVKMELMGNFLKFSFKTFCFTYLKFLKHLFNFKKEKILNYEIEVHSYSDFVNLFIDIFVYFVYYYPLSSKRPTIIDCGSNIGISVIFFKYMFPGSKILAFEPDPTIFSLLKKNCNNNKLKNVKLINAGLYDKKGLLSFFTFPKNSTNGTLGNTFLENKDYERIKVEVKVEKLSSYINSNIDLLKMDIEGSESIVLNEISRKLYLILNLIIEYHAFAEIEKNNKLSKLLECLEANFYFFINENIDQVLPTFDHHLSIIRARNKNNLKQNELWYKNQDI